MSVSSSFLPGRGSRALKVGSEQGSPVKVGYRGFTSRSESWGSSFSGATLTCADTCPQGVTRGRPPPSTCVSLLGMTSFFFFLKICLFTNSLAVAGLHRYADLV